jgi:hypothetical protein
MQLPADAIWLAPSASLKCYNFHIVRARRRTVVRQSSAACKKVVKCQKYIDDNQNKQNAFTYQAKI